MDLYAYGLANNQSYAFVTLAFGVLCVAAFVHWDGRARTRRQGDVATTGARATTAAVLVVAALALLLAAGAAENRARDLVADTMASHYGLQLSKSETACVVDVIDGRTPVCDLTRVSDSGRRIELDVRLVEGRAVAFEGRYEVAKHDHGR